MRRWSMSIQCVGANCRTTRESKLATVSEFLAVSMGASLAKPLNEPGGSARLPRMGTQYLRACCAALFLAAGSAQATVYELSSPDTTLFGREERVVTTYEDTLYAIA